MLKALGEQLRDSRKSIRASLHTVAVSAGISAPYLLKLERGQVNTPSPRVLGRLGTALDLPYLRLMELAGYLDEEQIAAVAGRAPEPHPLAGQSLNAEEWREVAAFIKEVVARRR